MGLHFWQVNDPIRIQERLKNLGVAEQHGSLHLHIHKLLFIKVNDAIRTSSFSRPSHTGGFKSRSGPSHLLSQRRVVSHPDLFSSGTLLQVSNKGLYNPRINHGKALWWSLKSKVGFNQDCLTLTYDVVNTTYCQINGFSNFCL